MYSQHQASASTPQPRFAPPRLHVDVAALDAHMGAVRRYYEQRLQQLENELATCRRTCRCHSGDHPSSAGSPPAQRAAFFVASSSSPAVTSSLMVSPISHRGAATTEPEARTDINPSIASSADRDAHMSPPSERSMYGIRASLLQHGSSTSPPRYEPSKSDRVLSHEHHHLPPQYPRVQKQLHEHLVLLQHNASQHNHQQPHGGGGSAALNARTASDHFFALPSQDYFRETLREVAGDSPSVAKLHNR
jgi:hypothetical protein